MNPPIHSSAADELFALQIAQFKHDEFYHREIARLTVHARLNHMALHFCKYVGQLANALRCDDRPVICRTLTDSFVIGLSSANILNLRLDAAIPCARNVGSLIDLGQALRDLKAPPKENFANWILLNYAVDAGRVARACEKIDHLEAFPFREEICTALVEICQTSLIAALVYNLHLPKSIAERFAELEPRYLFHGIQ